MKKIETIFTHTSDNRKSGKLGIDEDLQLYWNGQQIVTEQRIKISLWVNIAVIVGSLSTFIIALFTVLIYFRKP